MEKPTTTTSLQINSQYQPTTIRLPKPGQIWISYKELQEGGILRLGAVAIKKGEGIYQANVGAELTYIPPQNAHGVVAFQASWGYIDE